MSVKETNSNAGPPVMNESLLVVQVCSQVFGWGYLNHDPVMTIPLDTDFFYRQLLYLFSGRKFLLNGSGCVTIGSQESAMFELLKVTLKVSSKKDFI